MVLHYIPSPALQAFVRRLMLVRYHLDASKPRPVNPFPPQPGHCLYFYPYDQVRYHNYATGAVGELPPSTVIGPQLSRVDLSMGYNMLVILVVFQPGGLHRLLGVPMHELLDQPFDSTLFLGKQIEEITAQLQQASTYDQMMQVVEDFLLKKAQGVKRSLPLEQVLIHQLGQDELVTVDRLAEQACVSVRQLERQFNERIGMPPKVFTRLVRFAKAWNLRERHPQLSWLHIAHACGFADQMHLVRDFKAFAGVSPSLLQTDLEKSPLRLQADPIG